MAAEAGTVTVRSLGSVTFQNRIAPEVPSVLRSTDKGSEIRVEVDPATNSWLWVGDSLLGKQVEDLAKSFDKAQVEMDLEFCLLLINTDRLRDRGLSVFYEERASWLNALELSGDSGSLRLASGGFGLELSYQDARGGVRVVSMPVVRALDAAPWSFATDSEVPVTRTDVVEGVVRQFVEFRRVGFGLEGTVRVLPTDVILEVRQRNGSVATRSVNSSTEAPEFVVQSLATTLRLAWWEWSVLGGIQVQREELRKGLLRDRVETSEDFLVIFVRPRLALEAPPAAVPVRDVRDEHPLLPPKDWDVEENALIRSTLDVALDE